MPPADVKPSARRKSLPRAFRLKKRGLIQQLFDRGGTTRSVAEGRVRLLYRFVPQDEAGTAVPLQVAFLLARGTRPAVLRNRSKRIMRVTFQARCQQIVDTICRPAEVLLLGVLYRGSADSTAVAVRSDLTRAFDRLLQTEVRSPSEPH